MVTVAVPDRATLDETVSVVELSPMSAAVVRISGPVEQMPRLFGEAFAATAGAIEASHGRIAGPPFGRYLGFGRRVQAEVGFPFIGRVVETDRVYRTDLPGGPAVTTTHTGSYETIGVAWDAARAWIDEHGLEVTGPPWEAYLTGPEDPGSPVTQIYWPIASVRIDDH